MNVRRCLLVTAAAAFTLGGLTACQKPSPIVTVVNSGQSVYTEAVTFCFPGQSTVAGDCASRSDGTTTLEIVGGQPVGVDVSKDLVEDGWYIELTDPAAASEGQAPQRSELQDGHYFTFTAPNLAQGTSLSLSVRAVDPDAPEQSRGEWLFTLVPR